MFNMLLVIIFAIAFHQTQAYRIDALRNEEVILFLREMIVISEKLENICQIIDRTKIRFIPDYGAVYKEAWSICKFGTNTKRAIFLEAINNGHYELVHQLLQDPNIDPSVDGGASLIIAASSGQLNIVKLLLNDERIDLEICLNSALREAAQNGYAEIVTLLLTDIPPWILSKSL